jgi:hypothetical protein
MRILLYLLFLFPLTASAQMVYKCVGARGATVYQDEPCPQGARADKAWDGAAHQTTPEQLRANDARIRLTEQQLAARRARQTASGSYRSSAPTASDSRHHRCEVAKRNRDAQLERIGLRRTYDILQRLDAAVYEACK